MKIHYQPQPRQVDFHLSKALETLYGGAAGGGKSEALINDAIAYAGRYEGASVGLFRRTYPELERTLIRRFRELVPESIAHYNESKHIALFYPFTPQSSRIMFSYCKEEGDVYRYQSEEFDYLGFDELTHFTEYQYTYLLSRLRSTKGFPLRVRSGTNPGNIGHGWVKERFLSHRANEIWTDEASGITRVFIPAKLKDNPALSKADPTYEQRLNALPETERRALKDGDWDVFAGQYFKAWSRDRHVVDPFQLPADWRKWFGFDYGYSNPSCALWVAKDYDSRIWVYRELYQAQLSEKEIGDKLLSLTDASENVHGLADPSIFAKKKNDAGLEVSIADGIAKASGLNLQPAKNDRISGWALIQEYLRDGPPCPIHRELGYKSCPKLHVFNNCTNLIRTLPQQIHDEKKVEDLDTDGEDHAVDALRYSLSGVPRRNRDVDFQVRKMLKTSQNTDFYGQYE